MEYFVTGATGFIGKRLVRKLLARRGSTVHFLVRPESKDKIPALLDYWSTTEARAKPVFGDLSQPLLGVSRAEVKALTGKIDHFFHLAAVYDLKADAGSQMVANIDGTRNAVALANEIKAGIFQHASSIAAAGMYEGVFREDMFDEADRRSLLLLQADPEDAADAAAVDARHRHRGRPHQHRSGGLRGRRDRPHRAREGQRRAQGQQPRVPYRRPGSTTARSTSSIRRRTASATCSTPSPRPRTRRRCRCA